MPVWVNCVYQCTRCGVWGPSGRVELLTGDFQVMQIGGWRIDRSESVMPRVGDVLCSYCASSTERFTK
mgnify:CR=1 FL=1